MIRVRTASKDDCTLLADLNAVVHDLHVHHRPDQFVAQPEKSRLEALFRDSLDEPSVSIFIAELPAGKAVGYALARIVKRERSTQIEADPSVRLEQLAVSPEASRNGVGTALVRQRAASDAQPVAGGW
ncbi:GNAT family N-acetyltransferase [Streptomyces albidus (ex Kaewkla and Franco 2022)]|uniref:GNAT family N-acetyltransferase n=1 Tax=Streptomyces albidus (ex Kaewkla and Franco 2022) TaxID=722709 RepID=UPI0015EF32C6|nr:GNAT family N-acetyltransferase [Streptomyces albidus (ex Kaewkla and Franco 2022)]